MLAFALLIASGLTQNAIAASPQSASGVFVTSAQTSSGATVTIQQGSALKVYALGANATARERADDSEWKSIALNQIAQGEPVTLDIDQAGLVHQVDAQYTTVLTRLIVQRNGFLVGTSGVAYKLVGAAAAVQTPLTIGTFLKLRVDPKTNNAFDVAASTQPFSGGPLAEQIPVTFTVNVPVNTPTADTVYIASNNANWVANGIRMAPQSGNRWTVTIMLGKGSSLSYKYTRGSWQTAETNQSGIEIPNRSLSVTKTANNEQVNDVVLRWSDLPNS